MTEPFVDSAEERGIPDRAVVVQEDHFLPSMTCFETLRVAAALKIKGLSRSRDGIVEDALRAVGLHGVADSQVCIHPEAQKSTSRGLYLTDIEHVATAGRRAPTRWAEGQRDLGGREEAAEYRLWHRGCTRANLPRRTDFR